MDVRETRLFYHIVLLSICLIRTSTSEENIRKTLKTDLSTDVIQTDTTMRNILVATTPQTFRRPRYYPRGYNGRKGDSSNYKDNNHDDDHDHDYADEDHHDDHQDSKAMRQDYWGSYYDFLINEGSYKFWAVFQLATAALLIYSGFAALYYAKVNPPSVDYNDDDIFRRRRKRRSYPPTARDQPFAGLDAVVFQRIVDAIDREVR